MGIKVVCKNKKAYFNYLIKEKFEAGIELRGTEVKSIRLGKININDSYVKIDENNEAYIINMNIAHYEFGNINNHEETRKRKLLLHKREIKELSHQVMTQRITIVPVSVYFKDSTVKVEIAIAQGKKLHDKREDNKKAEINRKLQKGQFD